MPLQEQVKIFEPAPYGQRKIIVATNIAETSITIPGVVYVIDPCLTKIKQYDSRTNTEKLIVTPVSQQNCVQRAGRAGRTQPGKCYRLVTQSDFEKLKMNLPPEIARANPV
jgi:HrpA-like RNA helicase